MYSIAVFFARLWSYCYVGWGAYAAWSYVVQFFRERKYRDIKLNTFNSLALLQAFIGYGEKWRADSWKDGFDSVSSPQRAQVMFSGQEKTEEDLDCDDHMSYSVNVIDKSLAAGLMKEDGIQNPKCLTIMWMVGWKGSGHNVTLLEHPQPDGSVLYSFFDYSPKPSDKKKTVHEVAELVRSIYAGKSYVGLSWTVSDKRLKPLYSHWG